METGTHTYTGARARTHTHTHTQTIDFEKVDIKPSRITFQAPQKSLGSKDGKWPSKLVIGLL